MDTNTVGKTFEAMLDTVPYAAGVNNHEGSLGTSDPSLMDELMPLLHEHNLFFIDSRTTAATVAETAAHTAGVPAASRNVFLDDDQSAGAIRKQFALAIRDAREKGSALAIGHPHPETLAGPGGNAAGSQAGGRHSGVCFRFGAVILVGQSSACLFRILPIRNADRLKPVLQRASREFPPRGRRLARQSTGTTLVPAIRFRSS